MYRTFCRLSSIALAALTALATSAVQAAPSIYFGENLHPNFAVSGAPLAARQNFMANLDGNVGVETFETRLLGGTAPLPVQFPGTTGNITATLTGGGLVHNRAQGDSSVPGNEGKGRFNTTGAVGAQHAGQYWESSNSFSITFDKAISAFGFYGTDIGDWDEALTLTVTDTEGATTTYTVPATRTDDTPYFQSGALLFWGFIDPSKAYTKVSFFNTGAVNVDVFGFDDFIIADKKQIVPPVGVPEPGSLALIGLGLAGLAASRRHKKA